MTTKIYCITEWDDNMNQTNSELFMSIQGVANWLIRKNPISNQFSVKDQEVAGEYDITTDNLMKIMAVAAPFTIKQDFFIQVVETRFTLSAVNVND